MKPGESIKIFSLFTGSIPVLPVLLFLHLFPLFTLAQKQDTLGGRQVLIMSNDKIDLKIRTVGGALASVVMKNDPTRLNPLHTNHGHFLCVDGFGPVSPDERAAGLPGHGEANRMPWDITSYNKAGDTLTVAFATHLPLVQENLKRTIRMIDGENVVYIETELENLLAFDRPVNWGEHATIGAPFLELGKTVVEMSSKRGMTRSFASQSANSAHRLADYKEFTWPMAPGLKGEMIDVRPTPATAPVGDHTTSLMDPSRRLVFVTAFHPEKKLLLGYVFRREEYPWLQLWESYGATGRVSRGLEFAVQPFDMSRREVITQNTLFGAPTYRWLPAKSKIGSEFLMFWTSTPDGMTRVDDVVLENGQLTIQDRTSGKSIVLKASRKL